MEKFLKFAQRHGSDMAIYFFQHLEMCVITLAISLIIAIFLSLFLMKFKVLKKPVIAILGGFYAIPSMAFFAILVPFFGLGMKDAIVVLVVYSQFILVRNIVAGFQDVDASILEGARGMGMSNIQIFWRVQLPLAMPVIVSGIRIAAISTIGSTTIAQTVNAGGLGTLLFDGLRSLNPVKMLWGTLLAAILSLGVNMILGKAEKYCLRRSRGEIVWNH